MKSSIRIPFIYLTFASLWIILSDKIVESISDNLNLATYYSSIKGIIFVLATSFLLFLLILADTKKQNMLIKQLHSENEQKKQLITELHHRISSNIDAIKSLFLFNRDNASIEEKNRIISKLTSMESVFNILYNNLNYDRLTVKSVFDEYIKLSKKTISLKYSYIFNVFNIETLVSLLLIIDTIIDCLVINNGIKNINIEIKSKDTIIITFELVEKKLSDLIGHYDSFINQYLPHISGTLELQNDYVSHIIILFSDQNSA